MSKPFVESVALGARFNRAPTRQATLIAERVKHAAKEISQIRTKPNVTLTIVMSIHLTVGDLVKWSDDSAIVISTKRVDDFIMVINLLINERILTVHRLTKHLWYRVK